MLATIISDLKKNLPEIIGDYDSFEEEPSRGATWTFKNQGLVTVQSVSGKYEVRVFGTPIFGDFGRYDKEELLERVRLAYFEKVPDEVALTGGGDVCCETQAPESPFQDFIKSIGLERALADGYVKGFEIEYTPETGFKAVIKSTNDTSAVFIGDRYVVFGPDGKEIAKG